MKQLTKGDISSILAKYNLGKLKRLKRLERRLTTLNPSIIIITTKGRFFLKVYTKEFKKFKYHILKGLDLLIFLEKKKYPSIRVISAKNSKPYINYEGTTFAIFEFMKIKEKKIDNPQKAYELGKYLGKLHQLAKNFPISKTGQGYNLFKKNFGENFYLSKKAPKEYIDVLNYLLNNFSKLKVPSNQPKSVCHVEFTRQHVRFVKNKLVKVIDWDEVSRDYMIYDLGTTMAESFNKNSIDFNLLSFIIKGYQSQRELTNWERTHLFEAMLFGICKFVIWGLDEEEIEKSGWNKIGLQETDFLLKTGKKEFNNKLKKLRC